ncbi:2,3-bisphosphoglycerate-independent phosphoglycerate mutase [Anaplasma phagocytophilum]|uniref:2,3-bisphosphoglycerate-independent phosphoglycerate mutase n=1 Tax=Anaplasma phagocytophilum str. CRT38 TaxID=1269275 RepID=S6G7R7_ANAPH|nr:2,3-bisphosphoglycerate-independent phosphoglycerate mutase [Anaplasma phagocytophilum]EOA61957.1 phosphoglyceromutase [Anaplasma phagocytophilum str. CRT38]KDB56935.1 phosphoglyceromutase [Anaplasma phagocytophilum str. CRT35]
MSGSNVVLCILDGWGNGSGGRYDAIHAAYTPFWDTVVSCCPMSSLSASGTDVGLPSGQVGNSEVGHISIGCGRIVLQDLLRINLEINEVHKNPKLLDFVRDIQVKGGVCHMIGLLSDGGVHSLQAHMETIIEVITGFGIKVFIHVILDGRDVPPRSAEKYIGMLNAKIEHLDAEIATVAGRYYAMDRDNRLDRTCKAYDAIAYATGPRSGSAMEALEKSYNSGVTDEFMVPTVIGDYDGMGAEDGVLFTNFRNDRVLQLLGMLLHRFPEVSNVLGMRQYSEKMRIASLFPPREIHRSLGEVISERGLKQLRIAETEKFAHVTFFFNGGREEPFTGEDRIIIPSPDVSTYDLKPEMSAVEITDSLVERINSQQYALTVVNYANADMVGHTGNMEAAKKAVTTVDSCLQRVFYAAVNAGAVMLITADHGNAEKMFDVQNDSPFTAHTSSMVPFVVCNADGDISLSDGRLCDVAPTVLELMNIPQPSDMTGCSLITKNS